MDLQSDSLAGLVYDFIDDELVRIHNNDSSLSDLNTLNFQEQQQQQQLPLPPPPPPLYENVVTKNQIRYDHPVILPQPSSSSSSSVITPAPIMSNFQQQQQQQPSMYTTNTSTNVGFEQNQCGMGIGRKSMAIPNLMSTTSTDKDFDIDISELIDGKNILAEIEDEIEDNTLALARTHLFSKSTKSISIGLDPEKQFRFSVMLRNNRTNRYFKISYNTWLCFMECVINLQAYFATITCNRNAFGEAELPFLNHDGCTVVGKVVRNEPFIIIRDLSSRRKKDIWTITKHELQTIIKFDDIINFSYQSMNHLNTMVFEYYKHYVKTCLNTKKDRLHLLNYFTPPTHQMPFFDFGRLFHEIPICCAKKLKQDLELFSQ